MDTANPNEATTDATCVAHAVRVAYPRLLTELLVSSVSQRVFMCGATRECKVCVSAALLHLGSLSSLVFIAMSHTSLSEHPA
jgi:hypothetical protein